MIKKTGVSNMLKRGSSELYQQEKRFTNSDLTTTLRSCWRFGSGEGADRTSGPGRHWIFPGPALNGLLSLCEFCIYPGSWGIPREKVL